jgi:radical SAM superfamily enzyme YgiQ (UPF0313 family)
MLINLVSIHPAPSPQSTPLANAFLKAYSGSSSISVDLVDFFLGDDFSICAAKLAEGMPVAIGFSMYLWNRELCCLIAAELGRIYPSVKLFCGGPEVTADPESVFHSRIFDFVIVGEGELPFLALCQKLETGGDYSGIPGILLPGKPILPPPQPIANLDSIPSPYLTGVIDTAANPGLLWQLSRGCSFTCDFCFDSRGIYGVRNFSIERVKSELHKFALSGVRQVFVLDSTFNIDPKRAKKILRSIKKIAPDIHFHFEVRNEFIDREMAELFAQIPCSLQIGLQSADPEVLKLVGRSFNKADFTAKVGLLNNSGATFGFDLIYGLPGDTLAGVIRSLDYALSLYPNHLDIFPLAVLPGTRLATRAIDLNLQWNNKPPYLLEATESFSRMDMTAASKLAIACDVFYTRGKAVAWFNAIVRFLELTPSKLLQKFSIWMIDRNPTVSEESDFTDSDIWIMQKLFLTDLFSNKKHTKFLSLVLDLVTYHHNYAEVLQTSTSEAIHETQIPANILETRYRVAPSLRIISFKYDIEEILECGEPQITWMYENLRQSGSQAVIYLHDGIVCTESLAAKYIFLLEVIRDGDERISVSKTGLTKDEASEFIVFALQEKFLEIDE